MAGKATTVTEYLASLPEDRRKALQAVRKVIKANLDPAIKEGIQYGMIGYFLPHKVYPDGYHCNPDEPLPFASIASQKNHMGLYLFCIYSSSNEKEKFVEEWKKTGKRLDMGASCVRFKKIEDVPLEVVGRAIKRNTMKKFVAAYEAGVGSKRKTTRKATKKKATPNKAASKKTASKKKTASSATTAKKTKKKVSAKKVTKKKATKKTVARKTAKKSGRAPKK